MTRDPPKRQVIGFAHRGARAHAPENTIEGFLTACRMGAVALETDVWLSRDGEVIIDHDGVVRNGLRRVRLRDLDAAQRPSHMPTLGQLQAAIPPDTHLSIDVKDPGAAAAIVAIRAPLGRVALRRTWLCDADPVRTASWRDLDPDIRLVASIRRRHLRRWPFTRIASIGIDVVNLPHKQWNAKRVDDCHEAGLLAFAWGVQSPDRMHLLIDWGIDALFSDHTDRITAVLAARS